MLLILTPCHGKERNDTPVHYAIDAEQASTSRQVEAYTYPLHRILFKSLKEDYSDRFRL